MGQTSFAPRHPTSAWTSLLGQVRSELVLLLVVAAAVAAAIGDVADVVAIGAVLLLNVAIGFVTELRAHRAMEALLRLEVLRARVVREGRTLEVDARDLVTGDVILVGRAPGLRPSGRGAERSATGGLHCARDVGRRTWAARSRTPAIYRGAGALYAGGPRGTQLASLIRRPCGHREK